MNNAIHLKLCLCARQSIDPALNSFYLIILNNFLSVHENLKYLRKQYNVSFKTRFETLRTLPVCASRGF